MAKKREVIVVPRGAVGKICQSTGAGKTTVYAALNNTSFSEQAERIRQLALSQFDGVVISKPIFSKSLTNNQN